jgi:hypothetical protein
VTAGMVTSVTMFQTMPRYDIPQNLGKVRVAMSLGGKYVVWNGKQGRGEFRILCRNRKEATEIAGRINRKQHEGFIEV